MSDNTTDARPARKAGGGKFRRDNKPGEKGGKPSRTKSEGGKSFGSKSFGGKPPGGKSFGGKPFRGKPAGAKFAGGKEDGAAPSRGAEARPQRDRPDRKGPDRGRPSAGRPFKARDDAPRRGPARGGDRDNRGEKPFRERRPPPAEAGESGAPRVLWRASDADPAGQGAGGRPQRDRPDRGRPDRDRPSSSRPYKAREDSQRRNPPGGDRDNRSAKPYRPRPDAGKSGPRERPQHKPAAGAAEPAAQDRAPVAQGVGRIAKVIARAGACSRRDAEAWILAGRVAVNGNVLDSPAFNVGPEDRVTIDGQPLASRERTRLFFFHKPRGLVTTHSDPEGRPTIFDHLPDDLPRLVSVGRLDINTEGLMLLTNDGGLARVLELPATGWLRRYRVRAHGDTDQAQLDALIEGISIEGVDYRGIEARIDREQGANMWLTLGLREGKNREVKRILEHLGMEVNRLIRVSYGPFQLGDLAEGAIEEVPARVLKDQLGERLAMEAGADFEAPVIERRERQQERQWDREPPAPRAYDEPEERPRRKPEDRPPGKRMHVGKLRAVHGEIQSKGPRKRIEKGATEDRKGRAVAVERVVLSNPDALAARGGRNARRFASERADAAPARDERAPRREGGARPARDGQRSSRDGQRPSRDGAPGKNRFAGKRDGDKRTERGKNFDSRPPRESGPRGESTYAARSSRPRSDGKPRTPGGKPGGRPAGGKSFGGKPSGGDRPPRRPGR